MDATSIGVSGLNAMTAGVAVNANNVANVNTKDFKAKRLDFEDRVQGGVQPATLRESPEPTTPEGSNVDLATEFTSIATQADTYKANSRVLQAQKEMLGTVLDLKA